MRQKVDVYHDFTIYGRWARYKRKLKISALSDNVYNCDKYIGNT